MNREELHAKVWSQPMRTLARSMGISDVALAKRCKAMNVPVPPRGWWARKEAGQPVRIEPLPTPPFALDNYFPALEPQAGGTEAGLDGPGGEEEPAPGPPVFRDLAVVQAEIRAVVHPVKVPTALATPHPIVARLLKQDAQRKPAPRGTHYLYGDMKRFESPIQQRRLRILSALLTEFERLGCKVNGSTHAGERFNIRVGGPWTYIFLGIEGGPSASAFHNDRRTPRDRLHEGLRLDHVGHDDRDKPKQVWREDKAPLEQQATEIVRSILVRVEQDAREWALWAYNWDCETRALKQKEARLAAEKAEAQRIAQEEAAAAARIAALVDGADALERAARIRRYVEAVRAACVAGGAAVSADALEEWASWALKEADAIDPVVSGRFLASIGLAHGDVRSLVDA